MNKKIGILSASILIFAACEKSVSESKPQIISAVSPTVQATATPVKSKIKTYNGKGVVTKINLELVSVELDHEKIGDFMAAMKMEFYVKEKAELEVLKVGDKVDFVLEDNDGNERIISLKKEK